jgi:membrane protein DedA with SNARE-associated domain
MLALLGLAAATLISEDGACLTAALLIANGALSAVAAITACTAGIFVGDLALWAVGRGSVAWVSRWAWVHRQLQRARADEASQTIVRRAAGAIVGSRFLPGTRPPLYVAAGAMGVPFRTFAGWSLLACCVWTPAIILAAGRPVWATCQKSPTAIPPSRLADVRFKPSRWGS